MKRFCFPIPKLLPCAWIPYRNAREGKSPIPIFCPQYTRTDFHGPSKLDFLSLFNFLTSLCHPVPIFVFSCCVLYEMQDQPHTQNSKYRWPRDVPAGSGGQSLPCSLCLRWPQTSSRLHDQAHGRAAFPGHLPRAL